MIRTATCGANWPSWHDQHDHWLMPHQCDQRDCWQHATRFATKLDDKRQRDHKQHVHSRYDTRIGVYQSGCRRTGYHGKPGRPVVCTGTQSVRSSRPARWTAASSLAGTLPPSRNILTVEEGDPPEPPLFQLFGHRTLGGHLVGSSETQFIFPTFPRIL